MNYEEKYKQALERARIRLHDCNLLDCDDMTRRAAITTIYHLFPELAESDDERIRKGIIRNLQYLMDRSEGFVKEDLQERIAWFEKQGKQIQLDYEHADIPQKDFATIEPKFKVGDWVVNNVCFPMQIASIKDSMYIFTEGDAISVSFVDENYHLWTIEDARGGDVLAFDDDTIVIFKDLYNSFTFHSYCHIEDGIFDISKDDMPDWWEGKGFQPATKEQRDLLFQKMKEAGYEWDNEGKELKKIKPKTLDPDKVIEWLTANVWLYASLKFLPESDYPQGDVEVESLIKSFKKDFGL